MFPLIPWIETDNYVAGTNQTLANCHILKQTGNAIMGIEIPKEFTENDQCFDFWFSSAIGIHALTVKDFSQTVFDNDNSTIKRKNSYLF
jgi:hypothetical protein